MPFEQETPPDQTYRLHPVSILFSIGASVKSLLIPGLLVLFFSKGSRYEAYFMVLFIPSVIWGLLTYLYLRYSLARDEMVVQKGILYKNTRNIPYTRIQNIDLVQNPFHRFFRVAEVRIETASGTEPEAVLKVLSLKAVEELRICVFRERADGDADAREAPREGPLYKMDPGRLVLFGLISNRGMAVVLAALGLAWQFELDDYIKPVFKNWFPFLTSLPPAVTIPIAVVAALIGLRLLSVTWAVVKLYDFTLIRAGDDLRTSCGLLTRHSATLPRYRIQCLSLRENPLHRWFKRMSLRVMTAGGNAAKETVVSRQWLVPLAGREEMSRIIDEVQPEVCFEGVDWQPVDPRAPRRMIRKGVIVALLAGVGGVLAFGIWGLLIAAMLLPLVFLHAVLRFRSLGYVLTSTAILFRDGWWVIRRNAVRYSKIQSLNLRQSPFDRRYRMASVTVDTAGPFGEQLRIQIPYLPLREAKGIMKRLKNEVAVSEFKW